MYSVSYVLTLEVQLAIIIFFRLKKHEADFFQVGVYHHAKRTTISMMVGLPGLMYQTFGLGFVMENKMNKNGFAHFFLEAY